MLFFFFLLLLYLDNYILWSNHRVEAILFRQTSMLVSITMGDVMYPCSRTANVPWWKSPLKHSKHEFQSIQCPDFILVTFTLLLDRWCYRRKSVIDLYLSSLSRNCRSNISLRFQIRKNLTFHFVFKYEKSLGFPAPKGFLAHRTIQTFQRYCTCNTSYSCSCCQSVIILYTKAEKNRKSITNYLLIIFATPFQSFWNYRFNILYKILLISCSLH